MKRNIAVQKEVLTRQITIEKTNEVTIDLSDLIREIAYSAQIVLKFISEEITHKEYQNLNNDNQIKATGIYRRLNANKLFISDELALRIDKLYQRFMTNSDKIFEGYYEPNTNNRKYNDHQITFTAIKDDTESALMYGYDLYEAINKTQKKKLRT
jgi:hypothetical protein